MSEDKHEIREKLPSRHVHTYIYRGFRYGFTSLCAIVAGYLMQRQWSKSDLLILLIPVLAAIFFFICYANRFHSREPKSPSGDDIQTVLESEALYIFPVLAGLIVVIVLLQQAVPPKLLIAFAIYAALLFIYGIFLVRHRTTGALPPVRHQLVWPVVLTIGVSLYLGLSYSRLSTSLMTLLPLGLILLLYVLSEALSKKFFVWGNLSVLLATTIFTVLSLTEVLPLPVAATQYISTMLFCIAAAAYLAVFEAWRITADIARREQGQEQVLDTTGKPVSQDSSSSNKASQYSIATLIALVGSVWVLPFYFIFSQYGTFFLVCFALHALVAFTFWFYFGRRRYFLRYNWPIIKTVFGLVFFLILVLAVFFNRQPSTHFMRQFVGWPGLSILLFLASFPVIDLGRNVRKLMTRSRVAVIVRTFDRENRINAVRVLCLLCLIACFIISTLLESFGDTSERYFKAELAFSVYAICIVLCLFVNILNYFPPMSTFLKSVIGALQTVRIFTSSMIAMIVFLPAVSKGIGLNSSIFSSLPFFLAAMGGFALNDYCDISKDRINKPHRAIPFGRIKPNAVLLIAGFLIIAASFVASYSSKTKIELVLYISAVLGVACYNIFVKYVALSKGFLTSAISTLPVIYVVIILDYPGIYFLVPVASSLFLLGREWLMDINDVRGDELCGITTLPMIIGTEATSKISFSLQILGTILLVPLVVSVWTFWNALLLSFILISVSLMAILWRCCSRKYQRQIVLGLWIPMLCGILMLLN